MNGRITHALLDHFTSVAGDPDKLPTGHGVDPEAWQALDELLLDLHMMRHGYTTDGYAKHVQRRLAEECADGTVITRLHALRF